MSESNYWNACYQGSGLFGAEDCDGWLKAYDGILTPGKCVLDLGCGAGVNIPMLLSMGVQLTAADFSPDALRRVRAAYPSVKTDCFDMRAGFPYGDACFDAVAADLSLHYFSWADTRAIIAEIRRILLPGGSLIARVHSMANLNAENAVEIEPGYYHADGYTRRYFTEEDIRRLFSDWRIQSLAERQINRYNKQKHIIEFRADRI